MITNWTGFMGHFYTFTEWGYFFGLLKFQLFLWICLIFFFGLTVDASWSKHTYEEKKNENTPPPVMLTIQQLNLTIDIAKLDESLSPLW